MTRNETQPTTMAEAAEAGREIGARIFPLMPHSKLPFPGSSGFKDASFDSAQLSEWWTKHPDANVGIATGESNLQVLDFDHQDEIPDWLQKTRTYKVKTARGIHIYFRGARPTAKMYVDGKHVGEIKSIGGYVLGAGSVHPSGAIYTVVDDSLIAPAPAEEIDKLVKGAPQKIPATINGDMIPHGQHDTELTRIAGRLRYDGAEEDGIATILTEICEKRCQGYGTDYRQMCTKIAHSICKKDLTKHTRLLINGVETGADAAESATVIDKTKAAPFVTVDGDMFMKEDIPPRKALLRTISNGDPVFFEQSINQIFAWRGLGKTCLGFGLTAAFAKGESFLNWEVPERLRVLYIEGELPESQAQERWRQIIGQTDGYARLATIDKQPEHMFPSLASKIGMDRVEATLAQLESEGFKTDVLFLDSISTLFNVAANDEENWIVIQSWLISLRSRGICIFFFHHAGKSGLSRSHSKSEDMLDVSIKLEPPKESEAGCLHAVMSYDKSRAGLNDPPAEIKMRRNHSATCQCRAAALVIGCRGDSVQWEYELAIETKKTAAYKMFSEGVTVKKVAKDSNTPLGTVNSWRTKWAEVQRLNKVPATAVRLDKWEDDKIDGGIQ